MIRFFIIHNLIDYSNNIENYDLFIVADSEYGHECEIHGYPLLLEEEDLEGEDLIKWDSHHNAFDNLENADCRKGVVFLRNLYCAQNMHEVQDYSKITRQKIESFFNKHD